MYRVKTVLLEGKLKFNNLYVFLLHCLIMVVSVRTE